MKRNEILGEHKKGVRAVKYNAKPKTHAEPSKPTNPVAKNATAAIGGGAAGAHKDAKKASQAVRGQKHKAQPEMAEGYNPNSVDAEHRRKLDQSHAADLKAKATGPDATERDKQRYQNYLDKKEQMANDYNDRMEREDIEQEALYRRRGSSSAYDRDYQSSISGMDGSDKRDFKRREMDHELGHETNNYAVAINGRTWKVFASRNHAEAVARSLQNKGKDASVHETGAEPTAEAMGADMGKITKVDPATKKATLTKPDGSSMEVDSTALKPTPDGKMSMDTPDTDELKMGTAVVSTEAADVPYQVKQGPQPMAMTSPKPTAIVASKKWTAITPDIEAKATQQGFRKVMLKINDQLVPGLEGGDQAMGSKIIVAPSDFENMSRTGNAGTARRPMGVQSAEKTGIGAPPLRESDKVLLDKMLTIAGLR